MFKFIRLLGVIGLIGLGFYYLTIKAPNKHSNIDSEQKPQPDSNRHLKTESTSGTDTTLRPKQSDQTSEKLIRNYLAASGGKSAHISLRNITATGTVFEAGKSKSFELIETQDGKRRLIYTWEHLGRTYKMLYSFDGVHSWRQQLLPKESYPEPYEGRSARHFARQRWLVQPFVVPLKANFIFKYQGKSKVSGRSAYLVTGFGKNNERNWFYFDEENFLLTRWGGKRTIDGIEEHIDYSATEFAKVNGVLLPKKIEWLAENSPFGTITFATTTANQTIDSKIFYMPQNKIPTLRQAAKR